MIYPIIYSDRLKNYDFGPGHPFRGDRFKNFSGLFTKLMPVSQFKMLEPRYATDQELQLIHEKKYIQHLIEGCKRYEMLDPDTPLHPGLETAARLIVGGSVKTCETVIYKEFTKAFGIGGGLHHARKNREAGFCLYNDVAVGAMKLLTEYNLRRILILDTDVHTGDGTAEIFYQDPRVLLIDTHQDPRTLYPGKGFIDQVGEAEGEGFTVNIPLPPGASDDAYRIAFDELIIPLTEEYKPEIIIRNGGSDPHYADMLASMMLTLDGFKYIGEKTRFLADKICKGLLVSLMGSGYNPTVLPYAWLALISGETGIDIVLEEPIQKPSEDIHSSRIQESKKVVDNVKKKIKKYWTL